MTEIVIHNLQSLEIDGTNYGNVIDAIANNPQYASLIQTELASWYANVTAPVISEPEPINQPNWIALETSLRGSIWFAACYNKAGELLTVNRDLTILISAFQFKSEPDLYFALSQLLAVDLGLSQDDLNGLMDLLTINNFQVEGLINA